MVAHTPAALGAVARGGASTFDDPEALTFLRRRVGQFGLVNAGIGFSALIARVLVSHLVGDPGGRNPQDPSIIAHFAAASVYLAVWALCRRERSGRFVLTTEALGTILGAAGYVVMGLSIPAYASPLGIVAIVLTYNYFGRSVFVPSTAQRTLWIGAAIGLIFVPGVYAMYRWAPSSPGLLQLALDDERFVPAAARWSGSSIHAYSVAQAIQGAFWWSFSIFVGSIASQVFYGLRREVSKVTKLGQYQLERKLGEGGMGVVYLASHAMLRRPAAVKMLPPDRLGARSLSRFEREVQRTASLSHPNVITVFDYGRTPDDVFYYAMEYVAGATLEDVVEVGGPMPPGRVVHMLRQVAAALAEAHGVGLIHRDVKPANIMLARVLGTPDVVKVLDFGLVKELGGEAPDAAVSQTGEITGTPQYMSPEAIRGDALDGRADVYALGAVAYFCLTGTPVFQAATVVETCSHHLHSTPDAPSERLGQALAPELEGLVLTCLAKAPGDRPASALALLDALAALDVAAWTRRDASDWWQQHGPSLEAREPRESRLVGAATLAVDVARRR